MRDIGSGRACPRPGQGTASSTAIPSAGHLRRGYPCLGISAPERGTPSGAEATAALTQLMAGQRLTCHERDVDRYGRIVAQCFLANGRDIAEASAFAPTDVTVRALERAGLNELDSLRTYFLMISFTLGQAS